MIKKAILTFVFLFLFVNCEKTKIIQAYPERFAGVGIELEKDGQYAKIIRVIPNSPAYEAGIMPSDILIAIDNVDISQLTLAETVDMIRGEPGTNVILTIESAKDRQINVVSVKRKRSIFKDNQYIFEE